MREETTREERHGIEAERQREIEALAAEVTLAPSSFAYSRLAECYRRAGLPSDARRVAEVGLERHPEDVPGYVALGLALLDLGELEAARTSLGDALRLLERSSDFAAVSARERVLPTVAPADVEAPAWPAALAAADGLDGRGPAEALIPAALAEGSFAPGAVAEAFAGEPSVEEIDSAFDEAESQREAMHDVVSVAHEAMRIEQLDAPELTSEPEEQAEGDRFAPDDHPAFATRTMAQLLAGQGDDASADAIRASLLGAQGLVEERADPLEAAAATAPSVSPGWPDYERPSPEPWAEPLREPVLEAEIEAELEAELEPLLEEELPQLADPLPVETSPTPMHPLPVDAAEVPAGRPVQEPRAEADRRTRVLSTLDTWLRNIRRELR